MNEKTYRDLIMELVQNDGKTYFDMRECCFDALSGLKISGAEAALFQKAFEMGYLSAFNRFRERK